MKNILFVCLIFHLALGAVYAQEWQTDLITAKEIASKENKPIILVFQGSDWCAPCMKLEKEVWSTTEFIDYAKENFVLLLADFPRKKQNALTKEQQEKNDQLAEKYNKNGYFPLVLVLDKDGNVSGTTGYKNMKPNEYIQLLTSFIK